MSQPLPHRAPAGGTARLAAAIALLLLGAGFLALLPTAGSAQTPAWVDTGGDCLRLRTAPGLSSGDIVCIDHGEPILLLGGQQQADGFTWLEISYSGHSGWVAAPYITTDPSDVQILYETPGTAAGVFPEPPTGGLTSGTATTSSPAELAASQPFPVVAVWYWDLASQRFLTYIPGAPAIVQTLTSIPGGGVVMLRREGTLTERGAPPEASLTVAGTPNVFAAPPVGGFTQGVSGTTDPRFLVQAQPFTVQSVSYFHVGSQQWLVYIPGAPDHVNTLAQGQLRVDSVVTIRRGPDAPPGTTPPPSSETSDRFETSITYYFCVPGSNPAGHGDLGGYCGSMANGEQVHDGAAACKPGLLGQRFRIEGDPTARIYTCTDTGGSVLQDHRDIWFMNSDDGYAWWTTVGERAVIEIVRD